MPYKSQGKCIYKKDTGKKVGCTKGSVEKYMSALHTNVKESFDDAILHYLSEMDSTQSSTNPLGATTFSKHTPGTTPVAVNSTSPVDVDLSKLDDNNTNHIKAVCTEMGKPYNTTTHNEIALMIQNAKKQKSSTPQPVSANNLTQPTQRKDQPAVNSSAPSNVTNVAQSTIR